MTYFRIPVVGALMFGLALAPNFAHAASSKTACELTITTDAGETTLKKDGEVLVQKGEDVTIAWDSDNAKKATLNGEAVDLTAEDEFSPTKKTTYDFKFTGTKSNKKASCKVTVLVAEGKFNASSLSSSSSKPKLSGTASGLKEVQVTVRKDGETKTLFTKKAKVKGGKWSVTVSKKLSDGTYDVELSGPKKMELGQLATDTLVIGDGTSSSTVSGSGTLSVSSVPLLFGGSIMAGESKPISYLKLVNTSKSPLSFTGAWVKQNGSLPASLITGLEVRDDKGVTRGKVDGVSFNGSGAAFAPADLTLAAGETRLVTIRALLSPLASMHAGKQLTMSVQSIQTAGFAKGTFPIAGTTWTVR